MNNDEVTIHIGAQAREKLDDYTLGEMAEALAETRVDSLVKVREGLRGRFEQLMDLKCQDYIDHIGELREAEQIVVAESGGRPVGMVGYTKVGTNPDNSREVYEIVRGVVMPEARGKKISSALSRRAIQVVRESHPEADIMFVSNDEKIVGWCKRNQLTDIDLDKVSEIWHGYDVTDEKAMGQQGFILNAEASF